MVERRGIMAMASTVAVTATATVVGTVLPAVQFWSRPMPVGPTTMLRMVRGCPRRMTSRWLCVGAASSLSASASGR